MAKYTNNDHYERDKAALIRIAEGTSMLTLIENADVIADLLRQSKWIDSDLSIKPIPVVKDKHGKLIKDYSFTDWFNQLNQELDEIKEAAFIVDTSVCAEYELQQRINALAEELQDLITVCTSMLQWLGFDESKRNQLAMQVNEKNRSRGYLE